ncbi:MAG: flagellar hook-associated protein FlgK [Candidatus Marinimicrobia bacterium]|nr:flagellar hook-associated protein FlgK [Candidatus Neomarinimicrobiota bacterium]MCF7841127.1 flagellar hook-associated protein FlgK [Candidatus Neomarinimicrobiota bacterium]
MSIQKIFDMAKQSLQHNQSAINTSAKNIANMNSDVYKRRQVKISESTLGFSTTNGGIKHADTVRVQNSFIESQLRFEKQDLGRRESDQIIFQQVEDIFGEPSDFGLSNVLSSFWNSWSAIANDPESQAARTEVRSQGQTLVRSFQKLDTDLGDLQRTLRSQFQQKIDDLNRLLTQMGELNRRIIKQPSHDLLDQRDALLNEMAPIMEMDVRENANGTVTIASNGSLLISQSIVNTFSAEATWNSQSSEYTLGLKLGNSQRTVVPKSGALASILDHHNESIKTIRNQLDELAVNIAVRVNGLHQSGYNLDNVTGVNFFADGITGAKNFTLSPDVLNDASLIATASDSDKPGEGAIASAISDLQFAQIIHGDSANQFYNQMVSGVGKQVQEADFLKTSQEKLVLNLKNQRDAISGVSLDEEMTRLIEFEQAYQAAAKVISTVSDITQTIINMV